MTLVKTFYKSSNITSLKRYPIFTHTLLLLKFELTVSLEGKHRAKNCVFLTISNEHHTWIQDSNHLNPTLVSFVEKRQISHGSIKHSGLGNQTTYQRHQLRWLYSTTTDTSKHVEPNGTKPSSFFGDHFLATTKWLWPKRRPSVSPKGIKPRALSRALPTRFIPTT